MYQTRIKDFETENISLVVFSSGVYGKLIDDFAEGGLTQLLRTFYRDSLRAQRFQTLIQLDVRAFGSRLEDKGLLNMEETRLWILTFYILKGGQKLKCEDFYYQFFFTNQLMAKKLCTLIELRNM